MSTTTLVVTLLAAAMSGFSAASVFLRAKWVVEPMNAYGVPRSWWTPLGLAKAAGAAGLVAGVFLPVVGTLAGVGLVLYFAGAVVTVVRARSYSHVPFPLVYAAPVVAALALA
ncbi:membrane protein [Streptomyces eurocidicus]|uniref:Membrane protein n=1 Tax=Streptomyces eurocidicus TaxID=66423 RepID=A0A2N8NXW8_STREU|nr:DoxX family protein [Streptomyces eurocidicus]MBB5119705.1 hypothetical protein [Streptomyces eurocidicus]MBF6050729.1 DoxX family protein [Streptomyces eurocidicus]PNE33608.1 membrane protein [Streptomyces eurocidicus]